MEKKMIPAAGCVFAWTLSTAGMIRGIAARRENFGRSE